MSVGKILATILLLSIALTAFAGDAPSVAGGRNDIAPLMARAMADGLIAGGVVLVGNRSGIVYETAFGSDSPLAGAAPVTCDTVFDLASLTKVVATTPAIMKLAEEGRLSLVDPLSKWFPEFVGKGKDDVLVVNLLTHTSGLDDGPLAAAQPLRSAIENAAGQKLKGEPGSRFRYADINFILLAELVHRVSGMSLDQFTAGAFYVPLGMGRTGFNPDGRLRSRCAATLDQAGRPQVGRVQDPLAAQLGGVAGHAGLFSTAGDLARYCRMLLNGGELDGQRVLAERTVTQMTVPYFSRGGKVARGLGWDMASPYSSPRGNGFSEFSFGHTGYSGGSIWIDPQSGTYVIFLTVRLDYRHVHAFNKLRSDLSSLVAAELVPAGAERLTAGGREPASFR